MVVRCRTSVGPDELVLYRPASMPGLEIRAFSDKQVDDAARVLAERGERHRSGEQLLQ